MKSIRNAALGGFAGMSVLFALAAAPSFQGTGFIALRNLSVQYSGMLALSCMSAACLLAMRPRALEGWLGGLDRMYRLHRWLGIGALGFGLLHWAAAKAPGVAISLGWLAPRGPRAPRPLPEDFWPRLLAELRHPAESLGEWVFYALVVMIALALLRWFPYRAFLRSHRLMAAAQLALTAHSLVLVEPTLWLSPFGAALVLLMAGGCGAALRALLGQIGAGRRVRATLTDVRAYPESHCLEVVLDMPPGAWAGHKAGQFAFVTFEPAEGAHPFTIASAWTAGTPQLRFMIKELGDATCGLQARLRLGQTVIVEGPYGRFVFEDSRPHQIWIGAGVGITPFLARLEQLAATPAPRNIDLFHATGNADEAFLDRLRALALAAGVRLHVRRAGQGPRLTGADIRGLVPAWPEASAWFCGPASFGSALRRDFSAMGMPVGERFHQELFALR